MNPVYGSPPERVCDLELPDWTEFLHYLYLPVSMAGSGHVRLPARLAFAAPAVDRAMTHAEEGGRFVVDDYVYLTVRRGFATPDNPLNRPGWHCDGFGTDDLNYTWADRWGTRWADMVDLLEGISDDHLESMVQFEEQVDVRWIRPMRPRALWALTPYVVHATPDIPAPGGMRSFLKVSISRHRYNLEGNSHNHLFDYDWRMWPRDVARNDPAYSQGDFYEPGLA